MSDAIKMAFVGDIMCGDSFSLAERGAGTQIDKYGSSFVSEDIVEILRSHDFVMGNIECVLSNVGQKKNSLRSLHMRGRPKTCRLLAEWGLTAANVANNHILEQGRAAAIDTVNNLRFAGIDVTGAGDEYNFGRGFSFKRLQVKEQTIYIAGICVRREHYAYDGGGGLNEVLKCVETLRAIDKDAPVILSIHWGNENIDHPSIEQRQTAKRLIDAGVNVIIGHHPHVVQGISRFNGAVAAYSLGNFIFDGFSEASRWSIILCITMQNNLMTDVKTIPIERDPDFRPMLAADKEKERYMAEIARRSSLCERKIEDSVEYEREYRQEVQLLCRTSRKNLWRSLAKRFFGFRPIFWPQLVFRPMQRRLGMW